jgi:hypothetical protein
MPLQDLYPQANGEYQAHSVQSASGDNSGWSRGCLQKFVTLRGIIPEHDKKAFPIGNGSVSKNHILCKRYAI